MKTVISILLIFFGVFILFSCDHGPIGIFHSLEVETDLEDNDSLENTISVGDMIRSTNDYYIAAGSVFTREVSSGSEWSKVPAPSGTDIVYENSTEIAYAFSKVFAVFSNAAGDTSTLFELKGEAWQEVSALKGKRCDVLVYTADSTGNNESLFISVRVSGAYSLYYTLDGTTFTSVPSLTLSRPVTDGAWVSDEYWLLSGNTILQGSDLTSISEGSVKPDTTADFGGIHYSSNLSVPFISSDDGFVYIYTEDDQWINNTTANEDGFYDFTELLIDGKTVILVGSENGYKEMVFADSPGDTVTLLEPGVSRDSLSSNINYINTTLSINIIRNFFIDRNDDVYRIFACTSGDGLWINIPSGTTRVWGRE